MYASSDVRKAIRHPVLFMREMNKLYHSRLRTRRYNPNGVDIFNEDWDNLIILDSCRYDTFADRVDLLGSLEKKISRGGTSPEFIRGSFTDKQLHDTVYVTGNGWYFNLRNEINAELHYATHVETNALDPTPITERALEIDETYPDKRLVVHYMHPHEPFVGPTAESQLPDYDQPETYGRIQRREISVSRDVLEQAYEETLDCVVKHIKKLFDEFSGKTVVTADHGELLGERCFPVPVRDYGHHSKLYVDELVAVPWHVYRAGDRKEIIAEPPRERADEDMDEINEQLRHLGYRI